MIEQEVTETTESESLCFLCPLCLQGILPCSRFSLIDKCLLVDAKAVKEVHPIHKAQLLIYMKLLDIPLGLIINFHTLKLTDVASEVDPTRSQPRLAAEQTEKTEMLGFLCFLLFLNSLPLKCEKLSLPLGLWIPDVVPDAA